jgi:hypothetical protein
VTLPPGWYPNPSGEAGTRYWDGHNWTAVNAWKNKRGRRPVRHWFGAIIAAGLGLLLLVWGAHVLNQYRVGTPTTATVTHCSGGRGGSCAGTWSIGGVPQSGDIEYGFMFSTYSVGSSLDVRVSGGTAYTAHAWLPGFVFGGVLLAGPLVSLFARMFRRNSY